MWSKIVDFSASLLKPFGGCSGDLAIDLGTANTLIYAAKRGIILKQPSVVAMVNYRGTLVPYAFGQEAKMMLGRTPAEIYAIRPLKDGVIADFKAAEEMIKHFICSVRKRFTFSKPTVVVCVPYGSTSVERRAIQDAVHSAGAGEVFLIEEPMAAAIGSGLPVTEATGSMVIDIGGGTTEIGVISLGGVVVATSIRVGGDSMDESIVNYVRKHHNVLIGEATAEKIKQNLSVTAERDDKESITIRGRDIATGIPKEVKVSHKKIMESLNEPISQIISAVYKILEIAPPELAADIIDHGIVMTGGGALLAGLSDKVSSVTGLKTRVADNPLDCVAIGSGMVVENFDELKHVLFKQD